MAIGEIYRDQDLTFYLEDHEIDILKEDFIHGPLIHSDYRKEQGYFSMTSSTYWSRNGLERDFSIKRQGFEESMIGVWNIFLKENIVENLERGGCHSRYGNRNNKFHINVDSEDTDKIAYLWRLRNEREKIREELSAESREDLWVF